MEIIFVLSESLEYFSCEGTITITIEQRDRVDESSLEKGKVWHEIIKEELENILDDAKEKLRETEPLVVIIAIIIIIAFGIKSLPFILHLLSQYA